MANLMQRAANNVFEITAVFVIGVALIAFGRYYLARSFPIFVQEEEIAPALEDAFGWVADYL